MNKHPAIEIQQNRLYLEILQCKQYPRTKYRIYFNSLQVNV